MEAQLKIALVQQAASKRQELWGEFAMDKLVRGVDKPQQNKAMTTRILTETTTGFILSG